MEMKGHPATVSKLARTLGLSRATIRRKINILIGYGYLRQEGRSYFCADQISATADASILRPIRRGHRPTHKELVNLDRLSAVPD